MSLRGLLWALLLILGPIQWVTIAEVGLNLKLVHVPWFLLMFLGFKDLFLASGARHYLMGLGMFGGLYLLYFGFLAISSVYSPREEAFIIQYLSKIIIYFVGSLGVYLSVSSMSMKEFERALLVGSLGSVFLFLVIVEVVLQGEGLSVIDLVALALSSGDSSYLQFQLFRALFDSVDSESELAVSLRNSLIGFIFISYCLLMYFSLKDRKLLPVVAAILAFFIVLVSVSRSNIIATVFATLPILFFYMSKKVVFGIIAGAVFIFTLPFIGSFLDTGAGEIVQSRFGALEEDGRVDMYSVAFDAIERSPLLGSGAGYEVRHGVGKSIMVHNLFLASWLQAGVLALIAAIGFYMLVVRRYLATFRVWRGSAHLYMISGLFILPLVRSQVSGSGGNFTIAEWLCLVIASVYFLKISSSIDKSVSLDSR